MRRLLWLLVLGLLLLGAASLFPSDPPTTAAPVPPDSAPRQVTPTPTPTSCGLTWRIVDSPDPGTSKGLYGVAAVAAADVWAVGSYSSSSGPRQTLTEHWNGTVWSIVPSPNYGTGDNSLSGIAALAADNVWAVGSAGSYSSQTGTLIEHWNGAVWSIVSSPNPPGARFSSLNSVAARAPDDVWAVGSSSSSVGPMQTLIEHWNGTAWSIIPSANAGLGDNRLRQAVALATDNVWAVGYGTVDALIEHWDGAQWGIIPHPDPEGSVASYLEAVAGTSATDVWAAGYYNDAAYIEHTFITHWDGSQWHMAPSPDIPFAFVRGLTAVTANVAWAVGSGAYYPFRTFVEYWDGQIWNVSPHPAPGSSNEFTGVAAVAADDVWAVGSYSNIPAAYTLIEHYSLLPCPTPTATSTPTNTPIATPTLTPCALQFSDVEAASPFYAYIRCLACRGIVSGYSTSPPCTTGPPCFLPGSNVTRGQMSKFIANAASYADPISSTQQTFSDVPYSSPFWVYVERAYLHGVISGYSSSPPCTTGVPCFLPGNAVTRGQTAKFVANAAGYSDPIPPEQQTFTDVPASSPFWVYSERAVLHGVISGYTSSPPCTTGVPCFLGGNAVTRGQTAKFIANAFYPACSTPLRR